MTPSAVGRALRPASSRCARAANSARKWLRPLAVHRSSSTVRWCVPRGFAAWTSRASRRALTDRWSSVSCAGGSWSGHRNEQSPAQSMEFHHGLSCIMSAAWAMHVQGAQASTAIFGAAVTTLTLDPLAQRRPDIGAMGSRERLKRHRRKKCVRKMKFSCAPENSALLGGGPRRGVTAA
jgi:hypothetical protein